MILKSLPKILKNKRQITLQRLDTTRTFILNTSVINNFYHFNKCVCSKSLFKCEFTIKSSVLRQLHTTNAIFKHYNHVYDIIENDDTYSNSIEKVLLPKEAVPNDEIEDILQKQWMYMSNREVLKNFEVLSQHAHQHQKDITDSEYREILEILRNKCTNFTDNELRDMLKCLQLWNINYKDPVFKTFWTVIDTECMSRRLNWTVDEILLMNDYLYRLNMSKTSNFSYITLKKLSKKPELMSCKNLVHFAFLTKIIRKILIHIYPIEHCLEKYFDDLNFNEIGIIAMLFVKYDKKLKNQEFMIKFVEKFSNNMDTINEISIRMIVQILYYVYAPNSNEIYYNLLDSLARQIPRCTLTTVLKITNLKSRVLIHNENLMLNLIDKFKKEIKDAKLRQIAEFLITLHKFGYDPKKYDIYSIIMNEILDRKKNDDIERYSRKFSLIVTYMLEANVYSEEAIKYVLDSEYFSKVSYNNIYTLDQTYLILDYLIELEHPDYCGPRVEKKTLHTLLQRYGSLYDEKITQFQRSNRITDYIDDVLSTCKKTLGSESAAYEDALLPHYKNFYINCCYDKVSGEFISPKDILSQIPRGTLKYAPKDGRKWFAIITSLYNDIIRNTNEPTGKVNAEIRQLKLLGYTPILIKFTDWQNLSNEEEKQKYIKDLISV